MEERQAAIDFILKRFGGLTKLARALGHKNVSTVQKWKASGRIPPKQWPNVEKAAFDQGFFDITVRWLGEMRGIQEQRERREADEKKNNAAAEAVV